MEPGYRNIKETYKIEATLGKGSFATVKRAKHRETGERVAVKVFSKKKLSDDDREALRSELEILKQIDHPNIVRLIDAYEDERHVCFVIELMSGGELFEKVLELDQFSEADARNCIKALVDAVRYIHDMGIVHRDIKPENMLIPTSEFDFRTVKLADFGLARFFTTSGGDEEAFASTTCGTPGYIAPEILKQQRYNQ